MTIDDFISRLTHVTSSGDGWSARCPAHEDSQASLTVGQGDDGRILLHCHTGCSAASVVLSLGLDMQDIFPEDSDPPPRGRWRKKDSNRVEVHTTDEFPTWQWWRATYTYQHADGRPAFIKVRLKPPDKPKTFAYYRSVGPEQWKSGLKESARVIYRLPEVVEGVRAGRTVWITEGEKDADNLAALGFVATCNPEGANKNPKSGPYKGKWLDQYTPAFRGATVVICVDNDDAGRYHSEDVANKVSAVAKSVRMLYFPELPEKGDVSDWLAAGGTREQLETMVRATVPWEAPEKPPEDRPHLTDLGNCYRLVRRHGQDIHHVFDLDQWFYWNRTGWAQDKIGYLSRAAKDTTLSMYAEASDERLPAFEREDLVKWAKTSEAAARIMSMITLASTELGIGVQVDDLDKDPWLLNVENGTLDLKTGRLREHRREDLCTKVSPISYDPKAECPRWNQFLQEVMLGDEDLISFLCRAAGYSLAGVTTEHCAFFLHGSGRNGKSTFLDVLERLCGDYATTVTPDLLLETGRPTGGPTPELAALKGVRLAVTSELGEGRRLAEAKLKALTGGDSICARPMYGHPFVYRPAFRLWISTNHKPIIRGTDEGIWSRIRLVPWDRVFADAERDKDLLGKLLLELPGILNWALAGCLEWQRIGLAPPQKVRSAVEQYRADSDALASFLEECCRIDPREQDTAARLYACYSGWCERSGEKAMPQRTFGQSLLERGYTSSKGTAGRRFWNGLCVEGDATQLLTPDSGSGASGASDDFHHVNPHVYTHDVLSRNSATSATCATREIQEEYLF